MPRKPATRRPKAKKRKVIVGVQMTDPSPEQLAALKKIFSAKALASAGINFGTGGITKQAPQRRRTPGR